MVYVKLFLKLIPYVIELIKAFEKWTESEPGMGVGKKEAVMAAIKAVLDGWGEAVTGGAKDAWERLMPIISKSVDFAVGVIFNLSR